MSFTHKIVGKIIGDRKSKNYTDEEYERKRKLENKRCPSCGKKSCWGECNGERDDYDDANGGW